MKELNVISLSGGKDSTATLLNAIDEGRANIVPVFCDTGHEHKLTYEYVDYLDFWVRERLGRPIVRLKADFTDKINKKREMVAVKWRKDGVPESQVQEALEVLQPTGNPFLDLCLWKGRFPSSLVRFCTQELKIYPFQQWLETQIDYWDKIVVHTGERAEESRKRAKLSQLERDFGNIWKYRPLLHWSADDVFAMHKKFGVEPNPLYKQGMSRVGCMPCIMARKGEILQIALRFPEEIERVRKWEELVGKASKRGKSTFFPMKEGRDGILQVVEWSKTNRRGEQIDLDEIYATFGSCSSEYSICE